MIQAVETFLNKEWLSRLGLLLVQGRTEAEVTAVYKDQDSQGQEGLQLVVLLPV